MNPVHRFLRSLLRGLVGVGAPLLLVAGCANPMHYSWSYVPLHDAHDPMFAEPSGEIEYREVKDAVEMLRAEREYFRKGYVMVGYCNMYSPQLVVIAPGAARNWGEHVGASAVLHQFGDGHYLATYWARPREFVFGAYYSDDLPADARAALKGALHTTDGVIVRAVVDGSPAFDGGVRPGDLLISLDGQRIAGASALDGMLRAHAGSTVTLAVWSMEEGVPRPVTVALHAPSR
ncbi:MAG: PDZ domain-containing protein [Burkholderiales bacterium]